MKEDILNIKKENIDKLFGSINNQKTEDARFPFGIQSYAQMINYYSQEIVKEAKLGKLPGLDVVCNLKFSTAKLEEYINLNNKGDKND